MSPSPSIRPNKGNQRAQISLETQVPAEIFDKVKVKLHYLMLFKVITLYLGGFAGVPTGILCSNHSSGMTPTPNEEKKEINSPLYHQDTTG